MVANPFRREQSSTGTILFFELADQGNVSWAARALGLYRTALQKKIKEQHLRLNPLAVPTFVARAQECVGERSRRPWKASTSSSSLRRRLWVGRGHKWIGPAGREALHGRIRDGFQKVVQIKHRATIQRPLAETITMLFDPWCRLHSFEFRWGVAREGLGERLIRKVRGYLSMNSSALNVTAPSWAS
jgi:hypothetical protein